MLFSRQLKFEIKNQVELYLNELKNVIFYFLALYIFKFLFLFK
jgi:hypothetical protein